MTSKYIKVCIQRASLFRRVHLVFAIANAVAYFQEKQPDCMNTQTCANMYTRVWVCVCILACIPVFVSISGHLCCKGCCAECESALALLFVLQKLFCNFVKISTLLVCPLARREAFLFPPSCHWRIGLGGGSEGRRNGNRSGSKVELAVCMWGQCSRFVGGFCHYCYTD